MPHSSFRPRRRPLVGAATAVLAAATVLTLGPSASAEPADPTSPATVEKRAAEATALEARLGAAGAGVYADKSGKVTVNVTTEAAAKKVRDSGGTARVVKHGEASLGKVTTWLRASVSIPGTAWAVDPAANRVVVSLDESVSATAAKRIRSGVKKFGGAATVERVPGRLSTTITGGQAIYGGGSRCSLGFNVRSGSTYYFLTAGHCTNGISRWFANANGTGSLGPTAGSSFPGNDFGIVRLTNGYQPGRVYLYGSGEQDIAQAANAFVGQQVRRSGSTTGVRGGQVTALNATVNYAEGRVSGLIRTTVCAQPGDSGGSLFAGTSALGLTSGGSGNCSTGGTTFFQPVTEALNAYGVNVY